MSTLPSRFLLPPNGTLPKLNFPPFPVRPPCRRFRVAPSQRNSPQAISHSFPSVHPVVASVPLPPYRALPMQAIFHGFPSVHPVVASVSLPPNGTLPKLFPSVSRPSTLSSLPCPSLPTELSPSYFPRFPIRPPCRRFRAPPSKRNSAQAISHRFPSVHPVVASVSLPPNGALPRLFPTVSRPSVRPPCPCFRVPSSKLTELSPSYFPRFSVRPPCRRFRVPSHFPRFPVRPSCRRWSVPSSKLTELSPSYFPRSSVRPPCRCFRVAPSQRSSPQAIFHGFPSVHPVVAEVSLPPRQSKLNENPSVRDAFGKKQSIQYIHNHQRFKGGRAQNVATFFNLFSKGALKMQAYILKIFKRPSDKNSTWGTFSDQFYILRVVPKNVSSFLHDPPKSNLKGVVIMYIYIYIIKQYFIYNITVYEYVNMIYVLEVRFSDLLLKLLGGPKRLYQTLAMDCHPCDNPKISRKHDVSTHVEKRVPFAKPLPWCYARTHRRCIWGPENNLAQETPWNPPFQVGNTSI